jgi:autotransporter-associated beta strand protein
MLGAAVYATTLGIDGGVTAVNGGIVVTSGRQSYGGELKLGSNTTLTAGGAVSISGKVTNTSPRSLTIAAGSNAVHFGGSLSEADTRPTSLGAVSVTGGTVTFGTSAAPIAIVADSLSVTAGTMALFGGSVGSVCNSASATFAVCLLGPSTFNLSSASAGGEIFGNVIGTASLTMSGAGPLTLTGANTYSGGTTISAGGTLKIGNFGTSGSVTGNITNNGLIVFTRSDDVAYGGSISGSGSLTKSGAGTLTLSGANTYSGSTRVSAGTLAFPNRNALYNGDPNSWTLGNINVSSGATLALTVAGGGNTFTDTDVQLLAALGGTKCERLL